MTTTRFILAALLAATLAGCSEQQLPTPVEPEVVKLPPVVEKPPVMVWMTAEKVGGDAQVGAAGDALPKQLAVRILGDGKPVKNVAVYWEAGAGSIPSSSLSDANGIARAQWTLPTRVGSQTALATLVSNTGVAVKQIPFSATTVAGPAAILRQVWGSGQSIAANSCPGVVTLRASASDQFNNPVLVPSMRWSVIDGPIESQFNSVALAQPDASGQVSWGVKRTGTPGVGRMRATLVETGAAVEFTVHVTEPRFVVYLEDFYGDDVYFHSGQNCTSAPVDTVAAGATVQFINHRAYDLMQIIFEDNAFPASPPLSWSASYNAQFTVPGTYRYREASAMWLTGTIIVRP